jgi:imidazolonepropionase
MGSDPLLLINAEQLLTLRSRTPGPRRGPAMSDLGIFRDGAVLCVGGKIVAAGTTKELLSHPWVKKNRKRLRDLDCRGKVVLPGFVDAHTHPVFTSPRLIDFEKRISGATYEQIAEAGGGIRSSLDGVRKASRSSLAQNALAALESMSRQGTSTVEAKSGYGLSLEAEIKSLEALREASRRWPGTLVPTLLGAHVVPPEFRSKPDDYVSLVCEEMIPTVAKRKLADFVDVFTEQGAFSPKQTLRIFEAARRHKLNLRGHVCQLTQCSLKPLLDLEPISLDHLDHVSDEDIPEFASSNTVATLAPGANYFLGLRQYPPARKLIDAGVSVALATDYNPGTSPTLSMPFVLSLACTQMKMSPAEAITAATINGAASVGLHQSKGSLEPGKDADAAVFDVRDYREIAYWFATNYCVATVQNGHLRETFC